MATSKQNRESQDTLPSGDPSDYEAPKSAKDYIPGEQERIFLLGEGGAGKTTQYRTLSDKKIFLYAFDPNCLESLAGFDIDYEVFTPEITDLDLSIKTLKREKDKTGKAGSPVGDKPRIKRPEPMTYINWEDHFEKRMDGSFFRDYDVIGFDSATTFVDMIMDRVLYLNNRLGGNPEPGDYASVTNTFSNVMRVLTSYGTTIMCTGHVERQLDDTGRIRGKLLVPGRLRVRLPLLFTQIWGAECNSTASKESFTIQTRPNREFPMVRTTYPGLSMIEDVTIQDHDRPTDFGIGAILSGKRQKED